MLESPDFQNVLRKAIEHRLSQIIEEEAVKAAEAAGRRARELAPQIAVSLMERFNVETYHNQIVIKFDPRERHIPLTPKSVLI